MAGKFQRQLPLLLVIYAPRNILKTIVSVETDFLDGFVSKTKGNLQQF